MKYSIGVFTNNVTHQQLRMFYFIYHMLKYLLQIIVESNKGNHLEDEQFRKISKQEHILQKDLLRYFLTKLN